MSDTKKSEKKKSPNGVSNFDSDIAFDMYMSARTSPSFRLHRPPHKEYVRKKDVYAKYRKCAIASIALLVLAVAFATIGVLLRALIATNVLQPTNTLHTVVLLALVLSVCFLLIAIIVDCVTAQRFRQVRKSLTLKKRKNLNSYKAKSSNSKQKKTSTQARKTSCMDNTLLNFDERAMNFNTSDQPAIINAVSITIPMARTAVVSVQSDNVLVDDGYKNQAFA